jgi:hypothetical protein
MFACAFCSAPVENPREVFRATACARCGKDLKICLNCRFYSPGSHWDCSETIDEPVRDKDRGNFCTFFSFRDARPGQSPPGAVRSTAPGSEAARKKLDKLFGND